jgi:hypothetical protein
MACEVPFVCEDKAEDEVGSAVDEDEVGVCVDGMLAEEFVKLLLPLLPLLPLPGSIFYAACIVIIHHGSNPLIHQQEGARSFPLEQWRHTQN